MLNDLLAAPGRAAHGTPKATFLARFAKQLFSNLLGRDLRASKQMQLLETLALGGRRQLFLVRCDGHQYLVGAGADTVGSLLLLDPVRDSEAIRHPDPAAIQSELTH